MRVAEKPSLHRGGLKMFKQSKKMEKIPVSGIRKVFAEVNKLREEGKDIVSLGLGEPDFDTPGHIIEAMEDAVNKGATHYTANKGIPELREAICNKLSVENGLSYSTEEIICTVGVAEGVFIALTAFLDPGDEVLIPDPSWVNYTHVPVFNQAVPVQYSLTDENSFQIDIDELENKVTDKTRILVILDPSNPTGSVQQKETIEKVAEFARKHDLLVISDEIYERIVYPGYSAVSIASLPGMRERTIVLNGFAKSHAMTGWRIGYVAAPKELIDIMVRLHMYLVTHASTMVQWGAVAALNESQEPTRKMVEEFARRREFILNSINETKGLSCVAPGGAFYLFPNIRETGMECEDFCRYLLHEAGVAVIPGLAFGPGNKYNFRISYAASMEDLEKAASRIQKAMEKLLG
jgi:aspartate/methionine/tyrosine aminotransferase